MKKQAFFYPSRDGLTQIHAIEWMPDGEVRGVLQIAHGMVEFIDRYDRFASFMAANGFCVVGNDHLGHGQSVTDASQLGYFAEPDGNLCLVEDMHRLREDTRAKHPDVPCFILGHSMGSFLTRQYIEMHGEGLAGAIILGTGQQPDAVLDFGIALSAVIQRIRGGHHRSAAVNRLAIGSYNASFEPARTRSDWLTRDEAVVDAFVSNPLNQFVFTVNGYYNMFRGMRYAQRQENLDRIPKTLPVLVASGTSDPVGDFGKAPRTVAEAYRKTGIRDVTLKLYPEDRHELLNELDRETVEHDLIEARMQPKA